jgi:hypothetical protein
MFACVCFLVALVSAALVVAGRSGVCWITSNVKLRITGFDPAGEVVVPVVAVPPDPPDPPVPDIEEEPVELEPAEEEDEVPLDVEADELPLAEVLELPPAVLAVDDDPAFFFVLLLLLPLALPVVSWPCVPPGPPVPLAPP